MIALHKSIQNRSLLVRGVLLASSAAAFGVLVTWLTMSRSTSLANSQEPVPQAAPVVAAVPDGEPTIDLPRETWESAGLRMETIEPSPFAEPVRVTGKVAINEDRVAHIFPQVVGRIEHVAVRYGQDVRQGDVLAIVQSREVGEAKLELVKDRLALQFAQSAHQWKQQIAENTQALIESIESNQSIDEIERLFRDRPMGDYREQLLSAYANLRRARIDVERLQGLAEQGVSPGKQLTAAEATRDVHRAELQAWLEQAKFQSHQQLLAATQALQEAQTRVSVDETILQILGYHRDELTNIDPASEGEKLAHYPIRAPLDGTLVVKDAVLLERVSPERQLFEIADLSTVWIKADIYEHHLPLLQALDSQPLVVRSETYPDKEFSARVFYTGEIVDESTRTTSLTATADNSDRLLKPGMFVEVEFRLGGTGNVLQLPEPAVLEHEGESFVFVHHEGELFQHRSVVVGRRSGAMVEIVSGLEAGETVVVDGAFVLKSRLLADLLEED